MCLKELSDQVKAEFGKQDYGYKVFTRYKGTGLHTSTRGFPVKPGEWKASPELKFVASCACVECESARRGKLRLTGDNGEYSSGFHIFLTIEGARAWAAGEERDAAGEERNAEGNETQVRKVWFKDPVDYGLQRARTLDTLYARVSEYPAVVAKRIKVSNRKERLEHKTDQEASQSPA